MISPRVKNYELKMPKSEKHRVKFSFKVRNTELWVSFTAFRVRNTELVKVIS